MSLYASETPKVRASESNHWYTRDGIPTYTVVGKNGKERNATLRDARELNLVPSVTTIIGAAAKPALVAWMQTQVLMAALTSTKLAAETEAQYIDRIIADSKKQGKDGNAIERWFKNNFILSLINPAINYVTFTCGKGATTKTPIGKTLAVAVLENGEHKFNEFREGKPSVYMNVDGYTDDEVRVIMRKALGV